MFDWLGRETELESPETDSSLPQPGKVARTDLLSSRAGLPVQRKPSGSLPRAPFASPAALAECRQIGALRYATGIDAVQRAGAGAVPAIDEAPSLGAGRPLPEGTREQMEGSFGQDFSSVRIHESAAASDIGARAYTHGEDVVFAPGQLDTSSIDGRSLIGHELTHVVQQRAGRAAVAQGDGGLINADPALEAEADAMGARAARGEPVRVAGAGSGAAVQRKVIQRDEGDGQQRAAPTAEVAAAIQALDALRELQQVVLAIEQIGLEGEPDSVHGLAVGGMQYPVQRRQLRELHRVAEARARALQQEQVEVEGTGGRRPGPSSRRQTTRAQRQPAHESFTTVGTFPLGGWEGPEFGGSSSLVRGSLAGQLTAELGQERGNPAGLESGDSYLAADRAQAPDHEVQGTVGRNARGRGEAGASAAGAYLQEHFVDVLGLTDVALRDNEQITFDSRGRPSGHIGLEFQFGVLGPVEPTVQINLLGYDDGEIQLGRCELHGQLHSPIIHVPVGPHGTWPMRVTGELVGEVHLNGNELGRRFLQWLGREGAAAGAEAAADAALVEGGLVATTIGPAIVLAAIAGAVYIVASDPNPVDELGVSVGGRLNSFCGAYTATMRGEPLPGEVYGPGAEAGQQAARQRIQSLQSRGSSLEAIHENARDTTDLREQVYQAALPRFIEQADDQLARHYGPDAVTNFGRDFHAVIAAVGRRGQR